MPHPPSRVLAPSPWPGGACNLKLKLMNLISSWNLEGQARDLHAAPTFTQASPCSSMHLLAFVAYPKTVKACIKLSFPANATKHASPTATATPVRSHVHWTHRTLPPHACMQTYRHAPFHSWATHRHDTISSADTSLHVVNGAALLLIRAHALVGWVLRRKGVVQM